MIYWLQSFASKHSLCRYTEEVRCLVDIPAHVQMPSVASGAMAEYVLTKIVPQVPEAGLDKLHPRDPLALKRLV